MLSLDGATSVIVNWHGPMVVSWYKMDFYGASLLQMLLRYLQSLMIYFFSGVLHVCRVCIRQQNLSPEDNLLLNIDRSIKHLHLAQLQIMWCFTYRFSDGFQEERVEAILHQVELAMKHQTSNFGLHLISVSMAHAVVWSMPSALCLLPFSVGAAWTSEHEPCCTCCGWI